MTKRSAILTLFLIKEGGPFSALFIFVALAFALGGVFGVVWLFLVLLPSCFRDVPVLAQDPAKEAASTSGMCKRALEQS